jgi:FkbM family methyltransferase
MTRGDVNRLENENIRTTELFEYYKNNCNIKDDILKNIIENNTYYKNNKGMEFYDENGITIDHESLEYPEQQLVNEYILEDDIVLELGARYGTVSCNINKKLKNKKNQISVEPDERVWNALELNKIRNNCDFNIVNGFISNKKLDLTNLGEGLSGYGSTFIENNNTQIPHFSLNKIKQKFNIHHFTGLVADCEGFLETFLDENPTLYEELRILIFEADYPDKCNYDNIKQNLTAYGFINKLNGHQNVWIKIYN